MASDKGISTVLAFLHELFPTREITPATLDAWSITFSDWSDELLRECAVLAAKTPGRTFFPTPGEIAALRAIPPVDASAILRRISALGSYNPNGWIYPRIETVREQLGDEIAGAYAAAGAERCFADDDSVTQDIARREFAAEIDHAQKQNPTRPLLPPTQVRQITTGDAWTSTQLTTEAAP